MNDNKFRIEVQSTIESYIFQLMNANDIPASMVEDALNKIIVSLKERQLQEVFIAYSALETQLKQFEEQKELDNGGE
jgi:DNA-binding TFAR19-related protein (PDSD5 family)